MQLLKCSLEYSLAIPTGNVMLPHMYTQFISNTNESISFYLNHSDVLYLTRILFERNVLSVETTM